MTILYRKKSDNMTDKEFRRLKRSQLIEIIYELQLEQKRLQEENEYLKKELNEQNIIIENAGSIAEVTVGLTHIFEVAQQTADKYLEEVYKSHTNDNKMIEEAKVKAEQIIQEATDESQKIRQAAKEEIEKKRKEFQEKVVNVLDSYSIYEKYLKEKEKNEIGDFYE